VTAVDEPQALFLDEDLEQALRQLVLFGREGLPVLSHDGRRLRGWITRQDLLRALGDRVTASTPEIERGALAAEFAVDDPQSRVHVPTTPLEGYRIVEMTIGLGSPASGRRANELELPAGSLLVAVSAEGKMVAPQDDIQLHPGDKLVVLAPLPSGARADHAGERRLTRPMHHRPHHQTDGPAGDGRRGDETG
jgi:CIC family chloride channel protein